MYIFIYNVFVLLQALRACLYGPSSLTCCKPSTDTYGYKWRVKEVNPGALAFTATAEQIWLHCFLWFMFYTFSRSASFYHVTASLLQLATRQILIILVGSVHIKTWLPLCYKLQMDDGQKPSGTRLYLMVQTLRVVVEVLKTH